MYKNIRTIRIILALLTMAIPACALILGFDSIFRNMQILTSLISGSLFCTIFWFIVTLLCGRIYCSILCPLGTTMDCVAAAERVLSHRSKQFRFAPPANAVRWVFLAIAVLYIFIGGTLLPTLLDPYTAYSRMVNEFIVRPLGRCGDDVVFSLVSLAIASVVFISIILVSWKNGRVACNTICPVGTILGVAARKSLYHPDINTDKCINCGECERVCKAECIKLTEHSVDLSRCVVCFDCMAVCPNDAITFRQGRHRLGMPMMQATSGNSQSIINPQKDETVSRTSKPYIKGRRCKR